MSNDLDETNSGPLKPSPVSTTLNIFIIQTAYLFQSFYVEGMRGAIACDNSLSPMSRSLHQHPLTLVLQMLLLQTWKVEDVT